jgi:hypothetical protein
MKKILIAITLAVATFGNAFALESAINDLKSAVSPSILTASPVSVPGSPSKIQPSPCPNQTQMISAVILDRMSIDAANLNDANIKLAEARANLPKAGITYLVSYIYKTFSNADNTKHTVEIVYAAKRNVPADTIIHTVARFIIDAANELEAQQSIIEAKENLPKAGLIYISGSISKTYANADSTAQSVEIIYAR